MPVILHFPDVVYREFPYLRSLGLSNSTSLDHVWASCYRSHVAISSIFDPRKFLSPTLLFHRLTPFKNKADIDTDYVDYADHDHLESLHMQLADEFASLKARHAETLLHCANLQQEHIATRESQRVFTENLQLAARDLRMCPLANQRQ